MQTSGGQPKHRASYEVQISRSFKIEDNKNNRAAITSGHNLEKQAPDSISDK